MSWPFSFAASWVFGRCSNIILFSSLHFQFFLLQQRNNATWCSISIVSIAAFGKNGDCSKDKGLNRPNSFVALAIFGECSNPFLTTFSISKNVVIRGTPPFSQTVPSGTFQSEFVPSRRGKRPWRNPTTESPQQIKKRTVSIQSLLLANFIISIVCAAQ